MEKSSRTLIQLGIRDLEKYDDEREQGGPLVFKEVNNGPPIILVSRKVYFYFFTPPLRRFLAVSPYVCAYI